MSALDEPVLVLNRSWMPTGVATVRRALEQIYVEKAKIVCHKTYMEYDFEKWVDKGVEDDVLFVKTKTFNIQIPETVVLRDFNSLPKHGDTYSKHHVFKRDKYHCQYCGHSVTREDATIDHVVPRAQGGKTCWDNCVTACYDCNSTKADRTPAQAGMRLRSKPGKPSWKPEDIAERYAHRKNWGVFLGKKK
jgi:5-methylcytosine-specific restriction endonuclease McrA